MTTAREAAVDWIRTALRSENGTATEAEIGELAEVLHCIACNWNVPIERLIAWIHSDAPAKEWSGGEFRRWCEWYRAEREERHAESYPE